MAWGFFNKLGTAEVQRETGLFKVRRTPRPEGPSVRVTIRGLKGKENDLREPFLYHFSSYP